MAKSKTEHQLVADRTPAERWLFRFAITIPCGILLALLITTGFSGLSSPESMLQSGDFPAFYSAAKLLAYDSHKLYDFALQNKLQQHFLPGEPGYFLPFAYPPYTAALLSPFSLFEFETAKLIFVSLNALAFIGGAILLWRHFSVKLSSGLALTAVLLFSAPIGVAVIGAQNSAISFFLLSCFVVGFTSPPSSKSDALAGYATGFLFLKPQFALIPLLALAATRRKRALLCVLACCGVWFYIGTLVLDLDWLTTWMTAAMQFSQMNFQSNAHQMISLHGTFFALVRPFISSEVVMFRLLAGINFLVIGIALYIISRIQVHFDAIVEDETLKRWTAMLIVMLTAILPPQTSFYDISLFTIALFILWKDDARSNWLLLGWITICTSLTLMRSETTLPLFGLFALFLCLFTAIRWMQLLPRER